MRIMKGKHFQIFFFLSQAVIRIQNRNGFSEEESWKRVNSQLTNQERVNGSHVILSTQWEPEVTQRHVSF